MFVIAWITAAISLAGVWLNIRKHHACFILWGISNASWTIVDAVHGIWAQAALQFVYFVLSLYGLSKWMQDDTSAH